MRGGGTADAGKISYVPDQVLGFRASGELTIMTGTSSPRLPERRPGAETSSGCSTCTVGAFVHDKLHVTHWP